MAQHMNDSLGENVKPDCHKRLNGTAHAYKKDDAAVWPPGHARLCKNCFPEADQDDEGFDPDFDHTEVTDTVVRKIGSQGRRTLHLPNDG